MNIEVAAANYIQASRILRIETPLGADVLLPERMEMREAVNALFSLSISVRSTRTDLKADELVGEMVDVSVETGEGQRRTWNGLVVELSEGPAVTRGLRAYRLLIQPQHWLMTQRSDCRIWLDKTSVDVARILMSEHGLHAPVTGGVVDEPKPQHYSVQWNETDLAYLTRRLEEDGIFYWFEHEGGSPGAVSAKHTLHIASNTMGYTQGSDTDVRFAMGSSDRNQISSFEKRFRFIPGKRSAADWNFLTPSGVPAGGTPSLVKLPKNDAYDLYEYPAIGGFGSDSASEGITSDQVEKQSKLRMQAAETDHERIEGASTIRTLAPGRRFKPFDVATPSNVFEEHVVYEIIHTARDHSYETNVGELEYSNSFIALPSRVPATPHRATPRPRIDGSQVAIIAGPAGEEIHTEAHGRVKVWFPWDRQAKKDGSDTCWIRVMQNWGGAGWGGQIVPRIGMEAMVSYLDGDPDRPVIAGIVPNSRQKLPFGLPGKKTRSGFKTQTHKGAGFNELSFDDEDGSQQIYMHAQKDFDRLIKDNESTTIEKGNRTTTLQQGDEKKTLQQGNRSVTLQTGDEKKTIAQGGLSEQIAKSRATTANTVFMNAVAGKNGPGIIGHTADDQITLQVGPSKITLTKTNIVIQHAGSSITFDANVIDQIAGNIHLNKDKAG